MGDSFSIDPPYTLFKLPRPVDSLNGRIQANSASGITKGSLRRRTELVVGVDGECICIHSLKTSKNIAWYPLTPQSYLTSPPCSIVTGVDGVGSNQRYTFVAIRDELVSAKFVLHSFHETISKTGVKGRSSTSTTSFKYNIGSIENPIVFIEPITLKETATESDTVGVVIVRRNGQITGLSGDLSTELWHVQQDEARLSSVSNTATGSTTVQAAFSRGADFTAKRFLQARPDIASLINSGNVARGKSIYHGIVLFLVVERDGQRQLELIHLRPPTQGFTSRPSTQPLISWKFPVGEQTSDSCQYVLDDRTGQLQQLSDKHITTFDFSKIVPEVISDVALPAEKPTGIVSFGPMLSLVSFKHQCCLYNVQYESLQAAQHLGSNNVSQHGNRKRKFNQAADDYTSLQLVGYYPKLGFALGISGQTVAALQITVPGGSKNLFRNGRCRLIDSLGKNYSIDSEFPKSSPDMSAKWERLRSKLEQSISGNQLHRVDKYFFEDEISKDQPKKSSKSKTKTLPRTTDSLRFTRRKALFVLGLMFDWIAPGRSQKIKGSEQVERIEVKFTTPRVFQWLARQGFLCAEEIDRALRQAHPIPASQNRITAQDVVVALANHDPSLVLLSKQFELSPRTSLTGTVETFKRLLISFDTDPVMEHSKLLPNGIGDAAEGEAERELKEQEEAAIRDIQVATSFLEDDLNLRATALRSCIEKLGTCFPAAETTQALRSQLSRHELILVIELLRIELVEGRWTSHLLDFHPDQPADYEFKEEPIAVISTLISRAVDALGPGGWISSVAESGEDPNARLIPELRSETSAVLEGVQEAIFLSGFLKDFIHYVGSDPSKHSKGQKTNSDSLLPLGAKHLAAVSQTRIADAGEVRKRSKRDFAHRRSQHMGTYSFETIRV